MRHSSYERPDGVQHYLLCPEELDGVGTEDVVSGEEQVDSRGRGLLQHGHLVLVIRAPDEDRVHCGLPYGGVLGACLSPCLQPALVLLAETAQGPQLHLPFLPLASAVVPPPGAVQAGVAGAGRHEAEEEHEGADVGCNGVLDSVELKEFQQHPEVEVGLLHLPDDPQEQEGPLPQVRPIFPLHPLLPSPPPFLLLGSCALVSARQWEGGVEGGTREELWDVRGQMETALLPVNPVVNIELGLEVFALRAPLFTDLVQELHKLVAEEEGL